LTWCVDLPNRFFYLISEYHSYSPADGNAEIAAQRYPRFVTFCLEAALLSSHFLQFLFFLGYLPARLEEASAMALIQQLWQSSMKYASARYFQTSRLQSLQPVPLQVRLALPHSQTHGHTFRSASTLMTSPNFCFTQLLPSNVCLLVNQNSHRKPCHHCLSCSPSLFFHLSPTNLSRV